MEGRETPCMYPTNEVAKPLVTFQSTFLEDAMTKALCTLQPYTFPSEMDVELAPEINRALVLLPAMVFKVRCALSTARPIFE